MNITEEALVRIIADALRDAHSINTAQADKATATVVETVLWDVAKSITDEVWETQCEEAPSMPDEWLEASVGR